MFTSSSPYQLLTIANGSLTLKESLLFTTSDQSRHQSLDARFYLGGGSGADLDHPDSLHQLYIVCSLTMPQKADEEAGSLGQPLFADPMAWTATLQVNTLERSKTNDDAYYGILANSLLFFFFFPIDAHFGSYSYFRSFGNYHHFY
jgi:hypothetical protein